jgi:two-component system CheB/CheR fusion protein
MKPGSASFVVGIGCSAGGLEALEGLFRHMPADTGFGFVVVAHLAPDRVSAMPEIMTRFASMPVAHAEDGVEVCADHIYVIPPGTLLAVDNQRLQLRPVDLLRRERNPIDVFLASLGEDLGARSIALILSGGGTDGTLGLKVVKQRGGLTVAQGTDGSGPKYPHMSSSAIASGLVDLVLPIEEIGSKLVEYAQSFRVLGTLDAEDRDEADAKAAQQARREVCRIVRDQTGHDFAGYKQRTFMRRVQRRMQVLQIEDIAVYIERLQADADEVSLLFRDLLIGVTNFFRDTEAFAALERDVVPRLFEGRGASDTVRVWIPGCATGEEVYSLAILLRERMEGLRVMPRVQLFATDIDDAALDVARLARYPAPLLDSVSPLRLERFFVSDDGTYLVSKQIRDMCVFSSHSLVRDPPFSRIDLVSCRNLLIYLDGEMQDKVIPVFHYALRPAGFLFLGDSEGISQNADLFVPLDKKRRIFQRRDDVPSRVDFPMFLPGLRFPVSNFDPKSDRVAAALTLRRTVEARVLDRFAPAHVVVNRDGEVIHYSSRTGKYLEAAAGQPNRQLLALARPGLRLDLRAALQEAMQTRRPVERQRAVVELDEHVQLVDLSVEPLPDRDEPLFLVLFADVGPMVSRDQANATTRPNGALDTSIERFESELRDTRERLQGTIEEYETALEELKSANEELVSVNEELQSTNEELDTGKEEIQSVNEELQVVNAELNGKIDQLNRANSDLRNLFESTEIAIVFLDENLAIRSFTPAVTGLFSLIGSDRGRPLADITTQLDHPALHEDIDHVLRTAEPLQRRVSRRGGRRHFLMRVLPYRNAEAEPDGVVVTFVDVSTLVESEQQQVTLVHELNHRVRNMLAVVTAVARQTLVRATGIDEFGKVFMGRIEAMAVAYGLVAEQKWGDVGLEPMVRELLAPYMLDVVERVAIRGPAVLLRPKEALAFGMVLHELATNAAKYGALSTEMGQLAIEWDVQRAEGAQQQRQLMLRWQELGGPPIGEKGTDGFGKVLIEREIRHDLGGDLKFELLPEGLHVQITVPWRTAEVD